MAAALASSVFVGTSEFSFAQTAQTTMAALSSQVGALDFAGARATIEELQNLGIAGIKVGNVSISLADLLVMINAAESGQLVPAELAAYLDALSESTAQALFVSAPGVQDYPEGYQHTEQPADQIFPTGSTG